MQAVHFGAGSIGRGFIGDLLHDSGYQITLLDLDAGLNAQINRTHSYDLYVIEQDYRLKTIDRVRALSPLTDEPQAIAALADAGLITTAVWADNLPRIAPLLAKGLRERARQGKAKINVIVCENAVGNGQLMRQAILSQDLMSATELDACAAFPCTAVDRLVLGAQREGQQVINVGVDHELVIDLTELVHPDDRPIEGAVYSDNLASWFEKKLFIINGGHAWAGYMGWIYGEDIIQRAFARPGFLDQVKQTMGESAALIANKHGFSLAELHDYLDFACRRFALPGLEDSVARVCRSPIRKLAAGDRLVAPAVQCQQAGLDYPHLLSGIAAALLYDHPQDEQAQELQRTIAEQGVAQALAKYSDITSGHPLAKEILAQFARLKEIKARHRR